MGLWSWLFGEPSDGSMSHAPHSRRSGDGTGAGPSPAAVATLEQSDRVGPAESAKGGERPWWAPDGATAVELLPLPRPELSTEARALEDVLISHFDGHDLNMPPLPQIVERVLARLADPSSSLAKVADDLSEDQVIAVAVLRMCNSPLYRGLHKITSLRPAAARLGVKALRTLMLHEAMRAAMFQGSRQDKALAQMLWRCAFSGAVIMRALSQFTTVDRDEAFLIGLLHDIGNVLVLRVVQTQRPYTGYDVDIETFDYLCHEAHQEFGELVADHWQLPDKLKTLIANHHSYPEVSDPLRTERLQLHLSDMINAMLGHASPASYNLLESRAVADLGLDGRKDFTDFLDRLPDEVEEALQVF